MLERVILARFIRNGLSMNVIVWKVYEIQKLF